MKTVVIGGVAGGASFASRLRRVNENMEILMLAEGKEISFASCAIPYYLSGLIKNRSDLIERTPQIMKDKNNIDVRVEHRVLSINPEKKILSVKNLISNEIYEESYDYLVLSPGASPQLPSINGIENASNAFMVRAVTDADKILDFINNNAVKNVVIVGGGVQGLEFTETFIERGLNVTIVEETNYVAAPFDEEIANIVLDYIKEKGATVHLSSPIQEVKDQGKKIILENGKELNADMIFLATGVTVNSKIAKEAGIDVVEDGHIPVDSQFRTNKKDIFAIGDAIQTTSFITGLPQNSVLSTPANRQGHLLADILSGENYEYEGIIGSAVAKIFDLTISSTGLTENFANALELDNVKSIIITPFDIAPFYPGASRITLKIVFNDKTGKIYGAQAAGPKGVDKEIGIISTAIRGRLSIEDLSSLEIPYSPPYNTTRDPSNVLGYVAHNAINSDVKTIKEKDISKEEIETGFFLDIREEGKSKSGKIEATINIPLSQLRDRIGELPKDKPIYLTYRAGIQNYNASKILIGNKLQVIIIEED